MPASPSSVEPRNASSPSRVRRAPPRKRGLRVVDLLVAAVVIAMAAGFAGARRLGLFPEQPGTAPIVGQPAPTAAASTTTAAAAATTAPVTTTTTAGFGLRPLLVQEREPEVNATRPTLPSTPQPFALRPPSAAQPVHMLVVGDALADGIAKGLTRAGSANANLVVRTRTAATSGLARPEVFDWPAQLASLVTPDDELVVIAVGLNDAQGLSRASSAAETLGTDEWLSEYQARVERLIEAAGPRPVVVVGLPVVESASRDRVLAPVRAALAAQAAQHVNVRYLNLYPITSDGGKFIRYFDLGDGRELLARSNDGEHFTDIGNDLVAGATINAIWSPAS